MKICISISLSFLFIKIGNFVEDDEMYEFHRSNKNLSYSDYMIFSPDVVVFRDYNYNLIDKYHVSVISTAAVNCSQLSNAQKNSEDLNCVMKKVLKKRCSRILTLCLAMNIKIIVMGAFGCGVFGNRPDDISQIFKELIIDEGLNRSNNHQSFSGIKLNVLCLYIYIFCMLNIWYKPLKIK